MRGGALPSQRIHELMSGQHILDAKEENVRPSSLDLSITGEAYRVRGAFLPSRSESVESVFKRVGGIPLRGEKVLLEKGCCYALPLRERILSMPEGVYAYANPKSSSGRLDMHVRLMVDKCSRYDAIEKKYKGPLWLLVTPKTFPVIISPGLTLNQIRFFTQDTRFDELALETNFNGLLYGADGEQITYQECVHSDKDGSILLTLGLGFDKPSFEAIEGGDPIDLSLINHYDPKYYFREASIFDKSIILKGGMFYILSTREFVRVPPHLACEMVPMDERSGDLRSHYAGFIDPGWGVTQQLTGWGRTLTLEVRSFDTGMIIQSGQPIAKIRYEQMLSVPERHYDEMSPTYGNQLGPRLGKQFLPWAA